jgi:putative nucleotidyltransferase with HDIG domain
MKITQEVRNAVNAVNSIVPKCYLVGGAVRDMAMGAEPKDYDFVTPLLPDEVEQHIKDAGRHCWSGGKRFGTLAAKVWFNDQWNVVEITTFRHETYQVGSRKPTVTFGVGDITEELGRHDFTVNSVAVKPDGSICDPHGGLQDIEDDIIRAVGNPTIRFKEDPLRILRAFRFISTKGFYIEPLTMKSIIKNLHRLNTVSRERWCQEMDKLLLGDFVNYALAEMFYTGAFKHLIPELHLQVDFDQHSPYHEFPLDMHTRKVVAACPIDHPFPTDLRWAALLHDVGKPFTQTFKDNGQANYIFHDVIGAELVNGIAHRLKWSKARTAFVHDTVLHHITDPDNPLQGPDSEGQKR